jgi:CxxC-x17-CxxC domain-containing protein
MFRKRDDSPRQKVQGNWKCSKCGAEITELPFQPSGDLPLYCSTCHRERMDERRGSMGGRRDFQRQMVQGNWKCAKCGVDINQLPFQPKEGQEILCRDCYKAQKGY